MGPPGVVFVTGAHFGQHTSVSSTKSNNNNINPHPSELDSNQRRRGEVLGLGQEEVGGGGWAGVLLMLHI